MPDDDPPELDQPDAERVYGNYLITCRRLGVTAVPRDRAEKLIAEWSETIARGGTPTTH